MKISGILGALALAASAPAAPAREATSVHIFPKSSRVVVELVYVVSYEINSGPMGSTGAWVTTIGANTITDGKYTYDHFEDFEGVKTFPSKTCFDGGNYCAIVTSNGPTCDFEFWARNQRFSYKGVQKKEEVHNRPIGSKSFWTCSMNWLAGF